MFGLCLAGELPIRTTHGPSTGRSPIGATHLVETTQYKPIGGWHLVHLIGHATGIVPRPSALLAATGSRASIGCLGRSDSRGTSEGATQLSDPNPERPPNCNLSLPRSESATHLLGGWRRLQRCHPSTGFPKGVGPDQIVPWVAPCAFDRLSRMECPEAICFLELKSRRVATKLVAFNGVPEGQHDGWHLVGFVLCLAGELPIRTTHGPSTDRWVAPCEHGWVAPVLRFWDAGCIEMGGWHLLGWCFFPCFCGVLGAVT